MNTIKLPRIIVETLYTDKKKPHLFKLWYPVPVTLTNGYSFTIPEGFITDFTSTHKRKVPGAIARAFVHQVGRQNAAVLVHDYLYGQKYYKGRKWVDQEMLRWLLASRCSKIKAYTMYYVVRLFAKSWWDN